MKNGTAITIVRSSNGFIAFEQPNVTLPSDASQIASFSSLADTYRGQSVVRFIEDHFTQPIQEEPFTEITTMEVPNAE